MIDIRLGGIKQMQATIRAVTPDAYRLQEALRLVGEMLIRKNQERMDQEVDPDGNPWVPFVRDRLDETHSDSKGRSWMTPSDKTRLGYHRRPEKYRSRTEGAKLLQETGELRDSFRTRVERRGAEVEVRVFSDDRRMSNGGGGTLQTVHQDPFGMFGYQPSTRTMIPERAFLGISEQDEIDIFDTVSAIIGSEVV